MTTTTASIEPCKCKSDYQDKAYGKGNRVHNPCGQKNTGKHRCTVCGETKTTGRASETRKSGKAA